MGGSPKSVESAMSREKTGNTLNTIGTVLAGIGSIADSVNSMMQMSRGATPLPIGQPFATLGQGIAMMGRPMTQRAQSYLANDAINNSGLDDVSKNLLKTSVLTGDTGQAIRGAFNMLNRATNPTSQFLAGKMTPEEAKDFLSRKQQLAGMNRVGGDGNGRVSSWKDPASYAADKVTKITQSVGMTPEQAYAQGIISTKDYALHKSVNAQKPNWATQARPLLSGKTAPRPQATQTKGGDTTLVYDMETGTFRSE